MRLDLTQLLGKDSKEYETIYKVLQQKNMLDIDTEKMTGIELEKKLKRFFDENFSELRYEGGELVFPEGYQLQLVFNGNNIFSIDAPLGETYPDEQYGHYSYYLQLNLARVKMPSKLADLIDELTNFKNSIQNKIESQGRKLRYDIRSRNPHDPYNLTCKFDNLIVEIKRSTFADKQVLSFLKKFLDKHRKSFEKNTDDFREAVDYLESTIKEYEKNLGLENNAVENNGSPAQQVSSPTHTNAPAPNLSSYSPVSFVANIGQSTQQSTVNNNQNENLKGQERGACLLQ